MGEDLCAEPVAGISIRERRLMQFLGYRQAPVCLLTGATSLVNLRLSDRDSIITERFVAWKAIAKQLICASCLAFHLARKCKCSPRSPSDPALLEGVADIDNNTARGLTKRGHRALHPVGPGR